MTDNDICVCGHTRHQHLPELSGWCGACYYHHAMENEGLICKAFAEPLAAQGQVNGQGETLPVPQVPKNASNKGKRAIPEHPSDRLKGIRISLLYLPSHDLSPNARVHWAKRAKAAKHLRADVVDLAVPHALWLTGPIQRAKIDYEFRVKGKRRRDLDNLLAAMKPGVDGLVDAGLIQDDDCDHLELAGARIVRSDCDATIITISEVV